MTDPSPAAHPQTVADALPGASLDFARMPGHWLLAHMGKRVLRPGGRELSRRLLDLLEIGEKDRVVEFAPGLGLTARLALARRPAEYTAVERDQAAAARVRRLLAGHGHRCITASAAATGLGSGCATVVYGEAMLTMQTAEEKTRIVGEAWRLLEPGGRYGIHELCLRPDTLGDDTKQAVMRDLSAAIHVGARPLTSVEWRGVLEAAGFTIEHEASAPMRLLDPGRMIADEGLAGTMRIAFNLLRRPAARRRVIQMRRAIGRHQDVLSAIALVARRRN